MLNDITLRIEANPSVCVCLAIIATGVVACVHSKDKTRLQRDIRFKEIETDLRIRNANMVAGVNKTKKKEESD